MYRKNCEICSKDMFRKKKSEASRKNWRFCSRKCAGSIMSEINKSRKKGIDGYKKCLFCKKKFPYRDSLKVRSCRGVGSIKQKFCSIKCSLTYRNKSEKNRKKVSKSYKGENCHFWKGGVSSENKKLRRSIEFRLWRESVFARDNWTCQKCENKGGKLHPHHIQNFSQYPELRFAIDNGITFCKKCHQEFHKIYGIKNNNKHQVEQYMSGKN